jgi:hypothetical protein
MSKWSLRPEGCKGYSADCGCYEYTDDDRGYLEMISFGALDLTRFVAANLSSSGGKDEDGVLSILRVLEYLLEPINAFFQEGLYGMPEDAEDKGKAAAA